jgi:hypothetical protein
MSIEAEAHVHRPQLTPRRKLATGERRVPATSSAGRHLIPGALDELANHLHPKGGT